MLLYCTLANQGIARLLGQSPRDVLRVFKRSQQVPWFPALNADCMF